jgi:hypothetical protein
LNTNVGIGYGTRMKNCDMNIVEFISETKFTVTDTYSTGRSTPSLDADMGGVDDLKNFKYYAGSNGYYVVEFTRPLNTNDKYDAVINLDTTTNLIVAWAQGRFGMHIGYKSSTFSISKIVADSPTPINNSNIPTSNSTPASSSNSANIPSDTNTSTKSNNLSNTNTDTTTPTNNVVNTSNSNTDPKNTASTTAPNNTPSSTNVVNSNIADPKNTTSITNFINTNNTNPKNITFSTNTINSNNTTNGNDSKNTTDKNQSVNYSTNTSNVNTIINPPTTQDNPFDFFQFHGIILFIIWTFFNFFGYIFARFLKHYKWWYWIHQAGSGITSLITIGVLSASIKYCKFIFNI